MYREDYFNSLSLNDHSLNEPNGTSTEDLVVETPDNLMRNSTNVLSNSTPNEIDISQSAEEKKDIDLINDRDNTPDTKDIPENCWNFKQVRTSCLTHVIFLNDPAFPSEHTTLITPHQSRIKYVYSFYLILERVLLIIFLFFFLGI